MLSSQLLFADVILSNFSELSDPGKWPERLDFIAHIESPHPSSTPQDNIDATASTKKDISSSSTTATSISTNVTPVIASAVNSATCTDPLVIDAVRGWEQSTKRKDSPMQECFLAAFVDSTAARKRSKRGDDFLAMKRREFAGDAVVLAAATRLVQHLIASKKRCLFVIRACE